MQVPGETAATSFVIGLGVAAFAAPALTGIYLRQSAIAGRFGAVAYAVNLVGLGLFAWLMVAVLVRAFRRRGQTPLVAGLGLAAILVHSLFYNAFFEDPITWALFGLAVLAVPGRAADVPPSPLVETKEAVPV